MENYYWKTLVPHSDNTETMNDYLSNHLPDGYREILNNGSYAEIRSIHTGRKYAVHASGNGDFNNHFVRFEAIPSTPPI